MRLTRGFTLLAAALFAFCALALPAAAKEKKFIDDDAAKKDDKAPQKFLPDYDKLVKGSEADWVYFDGYDPKAYKTVALKPYGYTGKGPETKSASEYGQDYLSEWIPKSKKLGWTVAENGKKGDLTIEGNIAYAWEPSGAARFWGGWYANPGCVQELIGKDRSGKIVFEIRHKSRGSTVRDSVENGIQKIIESLEKGK